MNTRTLGLRGEEIPGIGEGGLSPRSAAGDCISRVDKFRIFQRLTPHPSPLDGPLRKIRPGYDGI